MKSIQECINEELQDITLYLHGERMDESLKDVFSYVKSKFQKVFTYLKGLVAKVGSYILPVEDKFTGLNEYTKHCFWLNNSYILSIIEEK